MNQENNNQKTNNKSFMNLRRLIREAALCWFYQADIGQTKLSDSRTVYDFADLFIEYIALDTINEQEISLYDIMTFTRMTAYKYNEKETYKACSKKIKYHSKDRVVITIDEEEEDVTIKALSQDELKTIACKCLFALEIENIAKECDGYEELFDTKISELSENWAVNEMNVVDRNLLRLAIAEITILKTPPKVALNEILEISKEYSQNDSFRFLNGVLDKYVKTILNK